MILWLSCLVGFGWNHQIPLFYRVLSPSQYLFHNGSLIFCFSLWWFVHFRKQAISAVQNVLFRILRLCCLSWRCVFYSSYLSFVQNFVYSQNSEGKKIAILFFWYRRFPAEFERYLGCFGFFGSLRCSGCFGSYFEWQADT